MKKKDIVNYINFYFKYLFMLHFNVIIILGMFLSNNIKLFMFILTIFSVTSFIFIISLINKYKKKRKFSKNYLFWKHEKFSQLSMLIILCIFYILIKDYAFHNEDFIALIFYLIFYFFFLFDNNNIKNNINKFYVSSNNRDLFLKLNNKYYKDKKTSLFLFNNISKKNKSKLKKLEKSLKVINPQFVYPK